MWSIYFFLALIMTILLLWLVVGPKLLLVKSVWVAAGMLLLVCGTMITGGGSVAAVIGGLFFVASGIIMIVTAINSYFLTQLRWAQERSRSRRKSKAEAAL